MATTTLVCKQCNFENEAERVYCHNCGAKLDRSLLPPEATRREDPVIVQERVRKMVSPRRGMGLRGLKNFLLSVLISVVLAALIVMARMPDGTPAINREAAMDAPTITDDMEAQQQLPTPHRLSYTEDQVNAYLLASIKGKKDSASAFGATFERVFVHFHEGSCAITAQYTLLGYPVYATTVHSLAIQNGTLVSDTLGGNLGRLRLSGKMMKFAERIFTPIWTVLDRDRKLLSQMQLVACHKGSVEMVTKPAGH